MPISSLCCRHLEPVRGFLNRWGNLWFASLIVERRNGAFWAELILVHFVKDDDDIRRVSTEYNWRGMVSSTKLGSVLIGCRWKSRYGSSCCGHHIHGWREHRDAIRHGYDGRWITGIQMVEGPKLIEFSNVRGTHFCFKLEIIQRFIHFEEKAKCLTQSAWLNLWWGSSVSV